MAISSRTRQYLVNLLLFVSSLFLVLLATEIGVRAYTCKKESMTLEEAYRLGRIGGGDSNRKILRSHGVGLAHIIRMSRNEKIIYELLPDISALFEGKWISTNTEGFRDKQYPVQKGEGVVRVVGIGDSFMFGQSASQDSLYLSVLEYELNNRYPELKVDVINMAVPGYNTAMEVETLKEKGLRFRPDIVMLGFVENDYCLPNFIRKKTDFFTLERSFLYDLVINRWRVLLKSKFEHLPLLQYGNLGTCDEGQAPETYKRMVGERMVHDSFEELAALAKENGFRVFVQFWETPRKATLEMAEALGFDAYIVEPRLNQYVIDNDMPDYQGSVLAASGTDPHLSDAGHRLLAGWLLEYFVENNVLDPNGMIFGQGGVPAQDDSK
ncbi:MAG: SGNH/GDSL hydrolase family protein [Thermodesulfovibrionales bacterium]|nr:SGNH/GDSL hydrolase family protein [Thermodesulfovibrionales bacterium]